jgi:2'-5' RNA ligase
METPEATLFFAVPVAEPVRVLAGRLQEAVRQAQGSARLPALEGVHVTLAFLGRTPTTRVPDLLRLAGAATAGLGPFPLATAGTGGFPAPGRARILWLGFAPQPVLDGLAERLRAALRAGAVPFDGKPFSPHLTLARFRDPVDLGRLALPPQDPVTFQVGAFHLLQSVPGPRGTRYVPLGTLPLP